MNKMEEERAQQLAEQAPALVLGVPEVELPGKGVRVIERHGVWVSHRRHSPA
jgi:hypothetical protein